MTFDERVNNIFIIALKTSTFRPTKAPFAGSFTALFIVKKSAAKSYRLLVKIYGEYALFERMISTCNALEVMISIKDKECEFAPKN